MLIKWTQHLKDPQDKLHFEKEIRNSRGVLDRQKTILDDLERDLGKTETDIRYMDTPNWAYKQAYKNGYRSCLEVIKNLVDLDQQNKDKA